MFEQATRLKLRYDTPRGQISVEDLWDLPLTHEKSLNLDDIAKELFIKLQSNVGLSFVKKETSINDIHQLKFDIVKRIIDIKMKELDDRKLAASNKQMKDKLLNIIAERKDEELKNKPIEELVAMVEKLEK